jgi:hypothetical protein
MIADRRLFESSDLTALDFCLWGWLKCGVNGQKKMLNTRDEMLACILDAKVNLGT